MSTSVVYNPRVAKAIAHLKSKNDIDIYVEDSSNPNMWKSLLEKYLPDNIHLESVTPLGGRASIIEACKGDQSDDGRKKLYIIDGDLDLIQGKEMPNLRYLYRLKAYSVENYLISERAILKVITSGHGRIDKETAKNKLDFSSWLNDNLKSITPLFVSYAAHEFLLDEQKEKTVSFSVFRLRPRSNGDSICPNKTEFRIKEVNEKTSNVVGDHKLKEYVKKISANINSENQKDMVSVKDYILPLLHVRMKNKFGVRVEKILFSNLLATYSDGKYDPTLTDCLKSICR